MGTELRDRYARVIEYAISTIKELQSALFNINKLCEESNAADVAITPKRIIDLIPSSIKNQQEEHLEIASQQEETDQQPPKPSGWSFYFFD